MVDYDLLTEQAEALCEDTPDEVAAMANLSSLIYYTLDRLNWAGFYRVRGEELILGPFQGHQLVSDWGCAFRDYRRGPVRLYRREDFTAARNQPVFVRTLPGRLFLRRLRDAINGARFE